MPEKTVNLRYIGGPASSVEIGRATGLGDRLVPGEVYELPRSLAKRTLASNANWEPVKGVPDEKEAPVTTEGDKSEPETPAESEGDS